MPKLDDEPSIVEKMLKWVNETPEFIKAIEVFFDDNCEAFSEEVDTEMKGSGSVSFMKPSNSTTVTHKLEYTDLYNRYLELFEHKMVEFIEREGSSVEAFYEDSKRISASKEEKDTGLKWFVEMLLASERYDMFHDVMVNHLKIRRMMKRHTAGK